MALAWGAVWSYHSCMTCFTHSTGVRYSRLLWGPVLGLALFRCASDTTKEPSDAGDEQTSSDSTETMNEESDVGMSTDDGSDTGNGESDGGGDGMLADASVPDAGPPDGSADGGLSDAGLCPPGWHSAVFYTEPGCGASPTRVCAPDSWDAGCLLICGCDGLELCAAVWGSSDEWKYGAAAPFTDTPFDLETGCTVTEGGSMVNDAASTEAGADPEAGAPQ